MELYSLHISAYFFFYNGKDTINGIFVILKLYNREE